MAASQFSNGSLSVNWTPETTAQANPPPTYTIKRSTISGGPYTELGKTNTSRYPSSPDTTLANNVTYYYVVSASNNTGNELKLSRNFGAHFCGYAHLRVYPHRSECYTWEY